MKKYTLIIMLIGIFILPLLSQTTINVPNDYLTIQEAITHTFSLSGSVTILVEDDIYDKFEINYLPSAITDLTIESQYGNSNCIIDGGYNGSVIQIRHSNYITIDGFTIRNGTGSELGENTHGGGILLRSSHSIIIQNCIITDNICASGYGGGIVCSISSANINNSVIKNNIAGSGGGISITTSLDNQCSVVIDDCIFINNSSYNGGGLYSVHNAAGNQANLNLNITNSLFYNNSATNNGGGLYIIANEPYTPISEYIILKGNTICNNSANGYGGIYLNNDSEDAFTALIENCILWGNTNGQIPNNSNNHINFSDIQGGFDGTGNINADPQFEDPGNLTLYPETHGYGLTDASPCVGTGDPSYPPDPDETTIDMGCFYFEHFYDIHRLSKGYNWESFPRLERVEQENDPADIVLVLNNTTNFTPFNFTYLAMETNDLDEDPELIWNNIVWNPNPYEVRSSWLCKIMATPEEERVLRVYGDRLTENFELNSSNDPRFPLELEEGEYLWLGFWLPRNQKMIESFGSYWGDVVKVKSEDWFYSPANSQRGDPTYPIALNAENLILQSGKGYMVLFENPTSITDFCWTLTGAAEEPEKKSEPENFTYTEKADYEAVDVFNIPPNVTEIGVFEDEVCVGAVVVEDTCAQILVYSDSANRDPIPFIFEIVTGRGFSTPIKDYQVLNLQTGKYETKSIFSGRQEYSVIRFGDEDEPEDNTLSTPQLHGNYPNPFNPTTTISFSLPNEQDIELTIYNIKGQKVKRLINGQLTAGQHSMIWDGRDLNKKAVSSGIYFYKLKTDKKEISRKMLLLK